MLSETCGALHTYACRVVLTRLLFCTASGCLDESGPSRGTLLTGPAVAGRYKVRAETAQCPSRPIMRSAAAVVFIAPT